MQTTATGPILPHVANPSLPWRKDIKDIGCWLCHSHVGKSVSSKAGDLWLPQQVRINPQRIVPCRPSSAQLCAPAISPPSCWHLEIFGVPDRHWVNLHLALVVFSTGSTMQDTRTKWSEHLHLPHRRPTQDLLEQHPTKRILKWIIQGLNHVQGIKHIKALKTQAHRGIDLLLILSIVGIKVSNLAVLFFSRSERLKRHPSFQCHPISSHPGLGRDGN